MKVLAATFLLILPLAVQAQEASPQAPAGSISGATIPIMRAPGEGSAPSSDGSAYPTTTTGGPLTGATTGASNGGRSTPASIPLTTIMPVPESTIQPKTVPQQLTPAQMAADQALRKQSDEEIATYATRVSDTCDTEVKARIDWTEVSPEDIRANSPADMCDAALQAVEQLCANSAAKARVAAEIKTIICTSGPTPSVSLHGGTMLYTIDWTSANPGATVYAWLASRL